MIAAIILAAGASRRMGQPKMLLPFGRSTVLETVIANVLASPAERTVVVLGAHRSRLAPLVRRYPVEIVVNPEPARGMLSSIQVGLRTLPRTPGAVFIMPGDHPAVPAAVFSALAEARVQSGRGLIVPVHGGRGGHPLLLDLRYRGEVGRLDFGIGLRGLLALYPEDILRLETDEAGVLLDLDRPEDCRRATGARGPARKRGRPR